MCIRDRPRLLLITNRKSYTVSRLPSNSMTLDDLERKNRGLDFSAIIANSPKSLEIDWDSLHIKFLAFNIVFTCSNFVPLHSRNFLYGDVKLEYHLQNTRIWPLKWQHPCETVAPSGVCKYIISNVSQYWNLCIGYGARRHPASSLNETLLWT